MDNLSDQDMECWLKATIGVQRLSSDHSDAVSNPPRRRVAVCRSAASGIIDLHGKTVHQAYVETKDFIADSKENGLKFITVITGLSGQIRKEFPSWFPKYSIEALNGGGAFKLRIR